MNADDVEEDVRYVNFGRTFYNIGEIVSYVKVWYMFTFFAKNCSDEF